MKHSWDLPSYILDITSEPYREKWIFLCGHGEFWEKEEGCAKSVRFQAVQGDCLGSNLGYSLHPPSITKLDKALSNLVSPQIWLCFEQEVELQSSWGLSSLRNPVILWKKISEVNQRPTDEASGESVRLTYVTSASAEVGCFFGWWDHTYAVVIIPQLICLSFLPLYYSEEQKISFPPLSLSPTYYSSYYWKSYLPKVSWEPPQQPLFSWGGKKGEGKDWHLADGRQNWNQCLRHNIFHWHFILVSISNIHRVLCI